MSKFKIGDVVEIINASYPELIGCEATIKSGLEPNSFFGMEHKIDINGHPPRGLPWSAAPECLRKKKPPEIPRDKSMDNKVPWDYLNDLMTDQRELV